MNRFALSHHCIHYKDMDTSLFFLSHDDCTELFQLEQLYHIYQSVLLQENTSLNLLSLLWPQVRKR